MKKIIALLLVAMLSVEPLMASPVSEQKQSPKPELLLEACFSLIVVGVGGYMWYKLHKLCKQKLPPLQPAQPPPVPPAPPATNTTSQAQSSNYNLPAIDPSDANEDGISYEDISWYTSTNSTGFISPDGRAYTGLITTTFQTCANLAARNWKGSTTIVIWQTDYPYTMYGVVYDASNNVVGSGYSYSTNGVPSDLVIQNVPLPPPANNCFYRLCATNQFCPVMP